MHTGGEEAEKRSNMVRDEMWGCGVSVHWGKTRAKIVISGLLWRKKVLHRNEAHCRIKSHTHQVYMCSIVPHNAHISATPARIPHLSIT